ncbi:unnamed protein product [Orchesella dallaii]|uniref:Palmitoyltransferase n=1 Tax=Orchesella dallaii TaxID=48710 RepID=A0ABP1RTH4_9HEXA
MEHSSSSDDGYSTSTYDYPRAHPVCKNRLQRDALQVLLRLFSQRNDWSSHGKLKRLCWGHIIVSPINLWWWMAEIFIAVTVAYLLFELFYFNWLTVVPTIVIAVIQWLAFYKTCLRDPGVQPKPPFVESFKNAVKACKKWTQNVAPTTIIEHPNGISESYQYCWKCHHFRTSDTTHCGTCDCCMIQLDHHCPVFGGCVAKNNLSAFHAMVFTMCGFWIYVLVFSIYEVTTSSVTESKGSSNSTTKELSYDAAHRVLYLVIGEIIAVMVLPQVITAILHLCREKKSRKSKDYNIPESEQIKEMLKFVRSNVTPEEEQIVLSLLPEEDAIKMIITASSQDPNHNSFFSPTRGVSHV